MNLPSRGIAFPVRGARLAAVLFKALALDFDGPLASADRIAPGVREALERGRQAGLHRLFFRYGPEG